MKQLLMVQTTMLQSMEVFDTEQTIMGEKVFAIATVRRNNGETNIRFGNKVQTYAILKTYKYSVKRFYKEAYELFLDYFMEYGV